MIGLRGSANALGAITRTKAFLLFIAVLFTLIQLISLSTPISAEQDFCEEGPGFASYVSEYNQGLTVVGYRIAANG